MLRYLFVIKLFLYFKKFDSSNVNLYFFQFKIYDSPHPSTFQHRTLNERQHLDYRFGSYAGGDIDSYQAQIRQSNSGEQFILGHDKVFFKYMGKIKFVLYPIMKKK